MTNPRIRGRGIRPENLEYSYSSEPGWFTVRVDDARNPEFWLEITLGEKELLAMLAAVRTKPQGEEEKP